jgi:hypothetical protein
MPPDRVPRVARPVDVRDQRTSSRTAQIPGPARPGIIGIPPSVSLFGQ